MGNTTTYTYDGVGNRVTVEDPNGNAVTTVYDSRNRVIEQIEPLGVTVSYTYDSSGNQQTVDRRPGAHDDDALRRPGPGDDDDQRRRRDHHDRLRRRPDARPA